jgi:phage gp29-like protein
MADTTNNTTPPKDSSKELGVSGTIIQNGYIVGEEYNRTLLGKAALRIYDEMRKGDSHVRGALRVVKQPLLSATWDMQPASDVDGNVSDQDIEVAEFCESQILEGKIKFKKFLREILTGLDFGHSVFEKVYGPTEYNGKARIGLEKVAYRKQTTIYRWVTKDGKPGITQQYLGHNASIPRDKLVVFTNEQEGDNYEGISLLRYVYKDWHMKHTLELVNGIGLEKQSVGVPMVSAKTGMTPSETDKEKARDALANMRANEKSFMDIPSTMTVEMMDMKGGTTKDVLPTLAYHKRGIYESVLANFMDLGGSSGSGAKSLSGDLTSLFLKAEEDLATNIVEVVTDDIIKQLCDLNFTDLPNGYPKLTFGSISDDDLEKLAISVNKLMIAGAITPDAELEDNIRTRYRFPSLPKEIKDNYAELKAKPVAPGPTPTVAPVSETKIKEVTNDTNAKDTTKASVIADAKIIQRKLIDVLVS